MQSKRWGLFVCVLSLIGVAVSVELTIIHYMVHIDPSFHSVCAVSEGVNCETVAISPYSVFFGVPVSVWGIIGYLTIGLLAAWSISSHRLHNTWPKGLLILLIAFAALASAILAGISAIVIDSFCLFCAASYGINATLLGATIWHLRRSRIVVLLLDDSRALVESPHLALSLSAVALLLFVALHFYPSYWVEPGWTSLPKFTAGVDTAGHHWTGTDDPRLEIVEFSDYQCPHCRAAHRRVRDLLVRYPDQIKLVHRHFPLDEACNPLVKQPFHPSACRLAEAAECAGRQEMFWEMNDALYALQKDRHPIELSTLAVRLGLDRSRFEACLQQHETGERIATDVKSAIKRKIRGTPTFFAGGQAFIGRIPEEEIARLLAQPSTASASR